MRKLLLTLVTLFVIYTVYYDFKTGTLTAFMPEQETSIKNEEKTTPKEARKVSDGESPTFYEIEVEPGATLLSITEQIHNGPIPVSIQQLVMDFKELNPEVEPEKIHIGENYKFPYYYE